MTTIPTLQELETAILNDLQAEYGSPIPLGTKVFLRAVAAVQAARLKLAYLAIGDIQKNIWPDTADPEATGGTLERFGRVKIKRNPNPAVAGLYTVEVTGTIGAVIQAQTTFKSDEDSLNPDMLFILDAEFILATTTDEIVLRALTAGVDSKLNLGDTLTSTVPILNVDSAAIVTVETVEPLAKEDIEEYREIVLEASQLEPQGGAASDYRIWARDAQGVVGVYPYATPGEDSSVDVYIEASIADSTDSKGTPSAGLISEVEDVIDFDPDETKPLDDRGRRPITVNVNVLPVSVLDVAVVVSGFDGTTDDEAIVTAAIEELINLVRPFIAGADILANKNDILNTFMIIGAITAAVPGIVFTGVSMTVDGVSQTTYTFDNGEIPFPNSVTYP